VEGFSVEEALQRRYACTRFERFDGINSTTTIASPSNTTLVQEALQALDVARRAPSGFNVQPYKLLMVSSPEAKEKLASYCIGHNAHRVRDSDCTVLFLADRQSLRELSNYRNQLLFPASPKWKTNRFALFKIQALVGLFSQGFPLPYWLSGPFSWAIRFGARIVSWFTRRRFVLPTLSSAEVWAQKNTMLVAMAYLLACTSRGIATCPMEGYCSWGIRQVLHIPRRYSIPLIVATGSPYRRPTQSSSDDAGMTHGSTKDTKTLRYPSPQVIFQNEFGKTESS
jgi:nitroreductase